MATTHERETQRGYRHLRIRKKIFGDTQRPRVFVHRSLKNFTVQLIDDSQQKVLFGISTLNKDVRAKSSTGGNVKGATQLGEAFAAEALKRGFKQVRFDRGGYVYHGRVKAFAEAARNGGLEF